MSLAHSPRSGKRCETAASISARAYLRMPWPPLPRRSGVKRFSSPFVVARPPVQRSARDQSVANLSRARRVTRRRGRTVPVDKLQDLAHNLDRSPFRVGQRAIQVALAFVCKEEK